MLEALTAEIQSFLVAGSEFERQVVANDNSCLFHSLNFSCARPRNQGAPRASESTGVSSAGGAVRSLAVLGGPREGVDTGADKTGDTLRGVCATRVQDDPTNYPPEVLGKVRRVYCEGCTVKGVL
jgi:hypothetical protein